MTVRHAIGAVLVRCGAVLLMGAIGAYFLAIGSVAVIVAFDLHAPVPTNAMALRFGAGIAAAFVFGAIGLVAGLIVDDQ